MPCFKKFSDNEFSFFIFFYFLSSSYFFGSMSVLERQSI